MNTFLSPLSISPNTLFLNKYKLKRKIGEGSFGQVWLADDVALEKEYAIKILTLGSDIQINERLLEAQVGHKTNHNNLVHIYQADITCDRKMIIIAMDYFSNGSITALANPCNFLPLPEAIRIMIDVLQGLEYLHLNNIIHNDIKPQNILIGHQKQAKLTDYGIVGIVSKGEPVQPSNWYILHAAPDVLKGKGIDACTDIFQAGLTMFRLLTGLGSLEAKFNSLGEDNYKVALANGSLIRPNDFPPYIPNAVRRIIMRAIDPDSNKQFKSALHMRRELEKISFPGYWTTNETGNLIGISNQNHYQFNLISCTRQNSNFEAFKTNIKSQRTTQIKKFTKHNIKKSEAKKLKELFLKAVVEKGNI